MTSAIDPTKPADGVPAVKADLRDNLRAAKLEIEALQIAQIPTGGLTNQVLAKVSAADFHTDWVDQTSGGGVTTASNVGEGVGLFKQKTGANLEFKTVAAGTNIAINLVGDTLEFAASASGGSSAHFLDVRNDFGATGDGSTDDTAALQAAIDAAPTKGAIIFLPRGSYRVTQTLVIPSVAPGKIKPVRFEGESASAIDGSSGGWAGGASSIVYDGTGACIDAYSAEPDVSALSPGWTGGSIRNLAIHNGGSGSIGVEANAILNTVWENVLIRGFPKNLKIRGEYYYARFTGLYSYRGQADFNHDVSRGGPGGPKANGATFDRCIFSECDDGPAFQTGQTQWAGQLLKFYNCWFEGNNAQPSVDIQKGSSVVFSGCYWENQDGQRTRFVKFQNTSGSGGTVQFYGCYARMTGTNARFLEVDQGSGELQALFVGQQIGMSGSAQALVTSVGGEFSLTSIGGRTSSGDADVPLYDGSLSDLAELLTTDCLFAASWSATGNKKNCIKGGWTVL